MKASSFLSSGLPVDLVLEVIPGEPGDSVTPPSPPEVIILEVRAYSPSGYPGLPPFFDIVESLSEAELSFLLDDVRLDSDPELFFS